MGLDFNEKCAKSWQRGWSLGKQQCELPTLFTLTNREMDRSFRAIPQKQRAFDVGKELLLVVVGEQVTVVDAGQSIGMSIDASKTLLDAIKALGTSAVGTVRRVSKVTGAAEIRIVH